MELTDCQQRRKKQPNANDYIIQLLGQIKGREMRLDQIASESDDAISMREEIEYITQEMCAVNM